jgi:hypothetical protein
MSLCVRGEESLHLFHSEALFGPPGYRSDLGRQNLIFTAIADCEMFLLFFYMKPGYEKCGSISLVYLHAD